MTILNLPFKVSRETYSKFLKILQKQQLLINGKSSLLKNLKKTTTQDGATLNGISFNKKFFTINTKDKEVVFNPTKKIILKLLLEDIDSSCLKKLNYLVKSAADYSVELSTNQISLSFEEEEYDEGEESVTNEMFSILSLEELDVANISFPTALLIDVPPPAELGTENYYPFTLYLSADNLGPHTAYLYAENSNSSPWQLPRNKWSHLIPQWRFTDTTDDRNVITTLTFSDSTIVLDVSGNTLGMTASAQFYYIDDMPVSGCNPILIWATLEVSGCSVGKDITNCTEAVPSYANSKVIICAPYYVNSIPLDHLTITRDGINPMFDFYWINTHMPHVITLHGNTFSGDWCPDSPSVDSYIFNVPITNDIGVSGGPVIRTITGLPSALQTWNPNNNVSYLSATDSELYTIGGYLRSDVVPLSIATTTTITASVSVIYDPILRHSSYIWISNPDNSVLNRLYIPCLSDSLLAQVTSFIEKEKVLYGENGINIIPVPQVTGIIGMSLSGFGGIYGIAIDPCYNVWASDAERDCIYKFSANGQLISSLCLLEMPSITALDSTMLSAGVGLTPAGIALDGIGNIWVSLFDSTSVLKFDAISGNLVSVINPGNFPLIIDPYVAGFSEFTDAAFKPTLAEPDKNNNIWVSFTNTLCSAVYKYDNNCNNLTADTIILPLCSNPMDLLIDYNNDLWVTLSEHSGPPYLSGGVWKYDLSTSPPSRVSALSAMHPEYLTMDPDGNLWYTSNFNTVNKVTPIGTISSFIVGSTTLESIVSSIEVNALEGIAADSYGRVFVINSLENMVYMYINGALKQSFKINPDYKFTWFNDTGFIVPSAVSWAKSAQAFGDWTGLRWMLKYTNYYPYPSLITKCISGESGIFSVKDFNGYEIRRFNESWNAAAQIQDYAISPHIHDNVVLWEGLIGTAWGDASGNGFGRNVYERAANFVQNHEDVDSCNIPQLYSLTKKLDVPIDDYNFNYPADLKRMMDIISINQQILWGDRCSCNYNITQPYVTAVSASQIITILYDCPRCGHKHSGNRGDGFDAATYEVTAYTPFIVRDKYLDGRYSLITPALCCNGSNTCSAVYMLSSNWEQIMPDIYITQGADFKTITDRFCFFGFIDIPCQTQIAGVINWDDVYTTLSEQDSSIMDWYGSGETIEKILNYILHKGLGLVGT